MVGLCVGRSGLEGSLENEAWWFDSLDGEHPRQENTKEGSSEAEVRKA